MIEWSHYPKSLPPTELSRAVVKVFESVASEIESPETELHSNQVLARVADGLTELGFRVETGKKKSQRIQVPVLFGRGGRVEKAFEADAYHAQDGYVLEVEAGRAVINNQFLKDLFQACMMTGVDYLAIAVRNVYEAGGRQSKDFDQVTTFFDTLYTSDRMQLPLKGILVVGY